MKPHPALHCAHAPAAPGALYPGNVLISAEGEAVVTNYGAGGSSTGSSTANRTMWYVPPEELRGGGEPSEAGDTATGERASGVMFKLLPCLALVSMGLLVLECCRSSPCLFFHDWLWDVAAIISLSAKESPAHGKLSK